MVATSATGALETFEEMYDYLGRPRNLDRTFGGFDFFDRLHFWHIPKLWPSLAISALSLAARASGLTNMSSCQV
eukprot:6926285-Prymnesium_polylepis.1